METRPRAVVVGLGSVTGLQTARLLAARGVPVVGIAGDRRHFAARTRVCERVLQAELCGEGLVATLRRLGPGLGERAVLYPCTDQSVLTISAHREELTSWFHVVLPEDGVVRTLVDKTLMARHAERHGLPVPVTVALPDRAAAERAAAEIPYPAVLKPSVKSPLWRERGRVKALRVAGPAELLAGYDALAPWADALVAQQFIEGGDDALVTCNCYVDRTSRAVATFVTRKRRQWPPGVGTASYAEEARDDEALALTLRLFATVAFRGLGYLEVKRDARTGRLYLIEANIGRPTGRSATAEAGGVDLLYTMYCDAVGRPMPERQEQRYEGVAWVDVRRDVLSALYYWRRGELAATDWYRSLRAARVHAVASRRDPLPFALELVQSGTRAGRRLFRAGRRPGTAGAHATRTPRGR